MLLSCLFGLLSVVALSASATARVGDCVLDVTAFGAVGDGRTLNTAAVQRAFQAAVARGPGCTVLFPSAAGAAGAVFLTGPLNLTSHTTVEVAAGATLRFPANRTLHPKIFDPFWGGLRYQPLLFCEHGCPGVALAGGGVIDGDGPNWWPAKPSGMKPPPGGFSSIPPVLFGCEGCDGLRITGVTVQACPFVCLHAGNSTDVTVSGITVTNPIDSPNTACMYLDSVVNAHVTNSTFACGDDHITVLAITRRTENVVVEKSLFLHGQGLTIGSQVNEGLRNVTYRDIVMKGALTGIRMKAQRAAGGLVEGLVYENLELRDVGLMITAELNFQHTPNVSANPPRINDVLIRNVSGWGDLAGYIVCLPESPCTGWRLENVFPEATSEVVLPYHCEHFSGTCTGCGAWPQFCQGMTALDAPGAATRRGGALGLPVQRP